MKKQKEETEEVPMPMQNLYANCGLKPTQDPRVWINDIGALFYLREAPTGDIKLVLMQVEK